MDHVAQTILKRKNIAALIFNQELKVLKADRRARSLLGQDRTRIEGADLYALLPELVGREAQIEKLVAKGSGDLEIRLVNRLDARGRRIYLNLLLLPAEEDGLGLLLLEDATAVAKMMQQINQQRYDQLLYQADHQKKRRRLGDTILGRSAAIDEVRQNIAQLSDFPNATVLLLGESGTGKSLAANVLHFSAMPADAPLIDINCAALPEQLIESELFGYEKGAFTHAAQSRPGLFEAAENGAVFLNGIGELPINLQAKLLNVLETKTFRRLGSNRQIETNARIIAATNRDLKSAVAQKAFRADLYYRLNVVTITMPPLRSMGEDVLLIGEHFVRLCNHDFNKSVRGLTNNAKKRLMSHTWPGNVRELANCIERAMIFCTADHIDGADLILTPAQLPDTENRWELPPEGIVFEDVERRFLISALKMAAGNKTKAARLLGLTRDTLRYRMEKHNL